MPLIRTANTKLCSYIAVLFVVMAIESVYISVEIGHLSAPNTMHILTAPYSMTSRSHFLLQRLLMDVILTVLIYWVYSKGTVSCRGDCSVATMFLREVYLLMMSAATALCPCCISQRCLTLRQHIYDLKQYQSHFGRSPESKVPATKWTANPNRNRNDFGADSDAEESLPNLRYPESASATSQCHGISLFDSPPAALHDVGPGPRHKKRDRRLSQVSICGIPVDGQQGGVHPLDHHREEDSEGSYDLQVPHGIVDEAAAEDDLVEMDDSKSEQYDNFADIMIRREMDLLYGQSRNGDGNENANAVPMAMDKEQHSNPRRGSIGNLAKKRRNSLILSAVDGIKQGIKSMTEKKQQHRESRKEQQFMKSQRDKWKTKGSDHRGDDDERDYYNDSAAADTDGDDEREYYNTLRLEVDDRSDRGDRQHQRSRDRLSAVRNSLKSIIPNRKRKRLSRERSEYQAVSMREHSASFADNGFMNRFEDDRRGQHQHGDLGTSTDALTDDDASIATYGTAKDCLDDDLEIELNSMATRDLMDSSFLSNDPMHNPSVSAGLTPTRNGQFVQMEQGQSGGAKEEETERSESMSLESISNSEDEESPPLQPIQINAVSAGGFGRGRRGSTTLQPLERNMGGDRLCVIDEDSSSSSEDGEHLHIRIKTDDDESCDDMMTASML